LAKRRGDIILTTIIQLISLGAIWGSSFLFLRIASPIVGSLVITDARVFLGASVLLTYALVAKRKLTKEFPLHRIIILAITNCAAPFALIAYAETHLTAGLGAILNGTAPLFAALLNFIVFKQNYKWYQYLGIISGICGVAILVFGNSMSVSIDSKFAVAAVLLAAFFYGIGGIYASHFFKGCRPINMAFFQQLTAAVLLLPLAIWQFNPIMPSIHIILVILALGIVCTGVAYILYFNLICSVGAAKTLTVMYLVPVFGVLWGFVFLHEKLFWSELIGLVIILFSIFLIYYQRKAPQR